MKPVLALETLAESLRTEQQIIHELRLLREELATFRQFLTRKPFKVTAALTPDERIAISVAVEKSSEFFKIPVQVLTSRNREHPIVWARACCARYLREKHQIPYQAISSALGKLDHATAMNCVQLCLDECSTNTKSKSQYEAYRKFIES